MPELLRRGFEIVPLPRPQNQPTDRELLVVFPFGMLRRAGSHGPELVEVQLAPRGRAAFRLNLGVVPPAGIDAIYGHVSAQDVHVQWLAESYTLSPCPYFHTWFSVGRWRWRNVTQADYEALVRWVVGLVPEVERALQEGERGPHIRLIRKKPL